MYNKLYMCAFVCSWTYWNTQISMEIIYTSDVVNAEKKYICSKTSLHYRYLCCKSSPSVAI